MYGENKTANKFIHIMASIVKSNLDLGDALKAIQLWTAFMQQDTLLKKVFKPTRRFVHELNLQKLLKGPVYEGLQKYTVDIENDDNKIVLEFCCFLLEQYGMEMKLDSTAFFDNINVQNDFDAYNQRYVSSKVAELRTLKSVTNSQQSNRGMPSNQKLIASPRINNVHSSYDLG